MHEIMRVHIPQATTAKEKMHKKFRPLILFAKLHKQMHFETTHILVITILCRKYHFYGICQIRCTFLLF